MSSVAYYSLQLQILESKFIFYIQICSSKNSVYHINLEQGFCYELWKNSSCIPFNKDIFEM